MLIPHTYSSAGWGMGAYVAAMGSLAYNPSLAPVGSAAAGNYYPGDTTADAQALNYLGYLPDPYLASHVGTRGSQAADRAAGAGAWDQAFQAALTDFQQAMGLTADGWIGPKSRSVLLTAVNAKNAQPAPLPGLPPSPAPSTPGAPAAKSNTMLYVGIAAAVAALGAGAYYLMK